MGQLIHLAVEGQGQVIIPGGIDEQDLPGLGIHHRQDIHIAAGLGIDVGIPLITAAAVNHEGLLGNGAGGLDSGDLMLGDVLVDNFSTVREVPIVLLLRQQGDIPLVENQGLDFIIIQSVRHFGRRIIRRSLHLAHALFHGGEDLLGVICIAVRQDAEAVALGIAQIRGLVLLHDDHRRHLLFHHNAGNLVQGRLHRTGSHRTVNHARRQQHGQHTADQFAQLIAPQGQLYKNMQPVHHQQRRHNQHQVGGCEHLGGHEPGKNGQAAHQKRKHHDDTKPIHLCAADASGLGALPPLIHILSPLLYVLVRASRFCAGGIPLTCRSGR